MKKILSLVFMVAAMMYATSANAQIKFGLKGGLNVTSMSFSEDVFDASNKTGFFVGPMVKVTVPIVGLSFDAAALYDQKEADVKYVGTNGDFAWLTSSSLLVHSGVSTLATRTLRGMRQVAIL